MSFQQRFFEQLLVPTTVEQDSHSGERPEKRQRFEERPIFRSLNLPANNRVMPMVHAIMRRAAQRSANSCDILVSTEFLAEAISTTIHYKCDGKQLFLIHEANGFVWKESSRAALQEIIRRDISAVFACLPYTDEFEEIFSWSDWEDVHAKKLVEGDKCLRLAEKVAKQCMLLESASAPGFALTLDKNKRLLACTDGVFDLETKQFRAGTPQDLIGRTCGHSLQQYGSMTYDDLTADPRIQLLLQYVQRAFGSRSEQYLQKIKDMVVGNVYHEASRTYLMYGQHFKSLTKIFLRAVLGNYVGQIHLNYLHASTLPKKILGDDKINFHRVSGARLVFGDTGGNNDCVEKALGEDAPRLHEPYLQGQAQEFLKANVFVVSARFPGFPTKSSVHTICAQARIYASDREVGYNAQDPDHVLAVPIGLIEEAIIEAAPLFLVMSLMQA